ncbi:hypothetical protein RND71_014440 [Anisodus tanguticus]|uniref:Uncharacterized protein n=1 Tax=Anisodus tanguticus TaxID=243964 RepID=A0AAE1SB88_9SOLA|nr:hypothetical protein RND71_014440 [Anisodus tanguticus]
MEIGASYDGDVNQPKDGDVNQPKNGDVNQPKESRSMMNRASEDACKNKDSSENEQENSDSTTIKVPGSCSKRDKESIKDSSMVNDLTKISVEQVTKHVSSWKTQRRVPGGLTRSNNMFQKNPEATRICVYLWKGHGVQGSEGSLFMHDSSHLRSAASCMLLSPLTVNMERPDKVEEESARVEVATPTQSSIEAKEGKSTTMLGFVGKILMERGLYHYN